MDTRMSRPRLAAFLWLLAVPLVTAPQPPLGDALEQVLDAYLDVVAPVSATLGDSPCRRQGLLYRDAVKQGEPWALHMLDAGAKLPPGLLMRNLVQLGDFDECLRVRHEHPELGVVEGQHCLVTVGAGADASEGRDAQSELSVFDKMSAGGMNMSRAARIDELVGRGHILAALPLLSATWSVCVPAACSAADVQLHLRSALPSLALRVSAHACSSRAAGQLTWDWQAAIAILVLSSTVVLVILGTAHDLTTSDDTASNRRPSLVAFSLYTNARRLFITEASSPDALASLHGVRCLATLGIVLFHYYMLAACAPLTNAVQAALGIAHWSHVIVSYGTLHVDAFLVISGTLLAFRHLRDRERGMPFSVRRLYVNRYFRLAPAHAVYMLVTVASVPFLQTLGNAPQVKANLESAPMHDACRGTRWLGLLYIANYFPVDWCQGVTWYLSVDMQLLWLSPLLLYPLWRRPRLGMALLGLLAVAGTGLVFTIAYQHCLHVVNPMTEPQPSANLDHVYFVTHARFVPWLFGLCAGALLARRAAPSHRQAALGWCACVGLLCYVITQAHASGQHAFVPHRLHSAVFFALMRPAWGLATAWIVFACETGYGGVVYAFLSWRGWQVPSRLCYAVFLAHLAVVGATTMPRKTSLHYSDSAMMVEFLGVTVLSLFLAALLHLAVEVPFLNLSRLQQTPSSVSRKRKKDF